jgi:hypothetical protein
VDGEPRNFAQQRGLDATRFDAECGRQVKATHVHVVANANDRVRASCKANDAVRNSRQLNHTFDFACHVLKHLAARLPNMPERAPLSMLARASCRPRRDGVSSFFRCLPRLPRYRLEISVRHVRTPSADLRHCCSGARRQRAVARISRAIFNITQKGETPARLPSACTRKAEASQAARAFG